MVPVLLCDLSATTVRHLFAIDLSSESPDGSAHALIHTHRPEIGTRFLVKRRLNSNAIEDGTSLKMSDWRLEENSM